MSQKTLDVLCIANPCHRKFKVFCDMDSLYTENLPYVQQTHPIVDTIEVYITSVIM